MERLFILALVFITIVSSGCKRYSCKENFIETCKVLAVESKSIQEAMFQYRDVRYVIIDCPSIWRTKEIDSLSLVWDEYDRYKETCGRR